MAYRVELGQEAVDALRKLSGSDRARLAEQLKAQLEHEPLRETTNHKPMRVGAPGAWELRLQPYRIFYEVDEADQTVWVVAVVRKNRETARGIH